MTDWQRRVGEFVAGRRLDADLPHRTLDLVSEVGEVAKEVLEGSGYGSAVFRPTPAWAEELGDVLFALACVANLTGVDLNQVLDSAVRKYERRLADRGDAGSAADEQ